MYLKYVFDGDFGVFVSHFLVLVSDVIGEVLLWIVFLVGMVVVVSFMLGILVGIIVVYCRGGWVDCIVLFSFVFLGVFFYFWLVMLVLFLFGFMLEWFLVCHVYSDVFELGMIFVFIGSVFSYVVLFVIIIVVAMMGGWIFGMCNIMIVVMGEDYICFV